MSDALIRAAARGDPGVGRRLAGQVAPGSRVSIRTDGSDVVAVATRTVHPFGGWLPGFAVTERAVAAAEPAGNSP